MNTLRFTLIACAAALLPTASVHAQATFYGIGDLPGGLTSSMVFDATKVGGTIYAVGGSTENGTNANERAIVWTSSGGLTTIPDFVTHTGGQSGAIANAITPDAAYIAARLHNHATGGEGRAAHVTTSGLSTINLGNLGGTFSSAALGISDSGGVLYGQGQYAGGQKVVRYTNSANSIAELPLVGGTNMFMTGQANVSADGGKVVGGVNNGGNFRTAGTKTFLYTHSETEVSVDVPNLAGGTWNVGLAITPAGSLGLVGANSTAFPNGELRLFNDTTDIALGSPDAALTLFGGGFNSDGSVVAGAFQTGSLTMASYIRNSSGWFLLDSVASTLGADLTGWSNLNVFGISPDATLVWGNGTHNGNTEGFVLEFGSGQLSAIPEPSTYAAIFGAGVLGFAIWRRRKAASVAPAAGSI